MRLANNFQKYQTTTQQRVAKVPPELFVGAAAVVWFIIWMSC